MKKTVLGVKIDDVTMEEAVNTVDRWLSRVGKHYIVTPNPEFLVTAQENKQFQIVLNKSDLSIPDGVGLKLGGIKNIVPGINFMQSLIKMAAEKAFTVGLLGGRIEVAEKTAERLKKTYPGLKISFAESGPVIDSLNRLPRSASTSSASLAMTKCDILFVAFGHPKQEYWIAQNLDKIPVKVAMGVGGAFDVISGKLPRAPKWLRSLKLEWLFRLMIQPWRIKRQLALLKYIWLIYSSNEDRSNSR